MTAVLVQSCKVK